VTYYGSIHSRTGITGSPGGGGLVQIQDFAYLDWIIDPGNASCSLTFSNNGVCSGTDHAPYSWLLSGVAADYELWFQKNLGDTPSGNLAQWLPLSTSRSFGLTRTVIGTNSCSLVVYIRRASDQVVLAMGQPSLEATVDA